MPHSECVVDDMIIPELRTIRRIHIANIHFLPFLKKKINNTYHNRVVAH